MKSTTNKKESQVKKTTIKHNKILDFILKNPIPYMLIILFSISLYAQSFRFGLINLDDDRLIKDNLQQISDINNVGKALKTDAYFQSNGSYYRPILTISLILDTQIGGGKYYIYHVTNALLHCLICCLLFYLFLLFNFDRLFSLLATLIFASHPLLVNAVAWIVARNDLFMCLFFLLSFIMLIKYFKNKNILYLFFHFFTFGLSLFSKETSLIFPIIYLIYILIIKRERIFSSRNMIFITGWSFFILIFVILRSQVVSNSNDYQSPFQNIIYNISVIPELITKFFIPYNLAPLPFYNNINIIVGLIILAVFIFLFYFKLKIFSTVNNNKDKSQNTGFLSFFGILLFIILLMPGTIIKYGGGKFFDYLECRAYLPVIGLLLAIGSIPFVNHLFLIHKKIFVIVSSIIILIFTLLTLNLTKVYSEPTVFANYVTEKCPNSAIAWYSKGLVLVNAGKYREAIECYDKATDLKPDYPIAWNNKGNALFNSGRDEEAVKCYDKSLEIAKDNYEVWYNKGKALNHLRKGEEAIQCYNKAIELKPDYIEAWNNKGIANHILGKYQESIKCFDEAIKLKPENPETWFNKAKALSSQGNIEEALKCYDKALEIKSDYPEAWINKGVAYRNLGKNEEAIKCYDKSLEIKPDFIEGWINKGNALLDLGKAEESLKCYDKALTIKPDNQDAIMSRNIALNKLGK